MGAVMGSSHSHSWSERAGRDSFDAGCERLFPAAQDARCDPGAFFGSAECGWIDNAHHLVLAAIWSIYGAAALRAGIRRRRESLRVAAFLLLGGAVCQFLVRDCSY